MHGVLLTPIMMIFKKSVHKNEKIGFLLVIIAVLAIIFDPSSHRVDAAQPTTNTQAGAKKAKHQIEYMSAYQCDILMFLSNIPAAVYFALNRNLMRGRVLEHIIIMNLTVMIIFTISAIIFENATMDAHGKYGIFGWTNNKE